MAKCSECGKKIRQNKFVVRSSSKIVCLECIEKMKQARIEKTHARRVAKKLMTAVKKAKLTFPADRIDDPDPQPEIKEDD